MKNKFFAQRNYLFQILILLGSGFSAALWAHDFWLEAKPFYTSPGETVDISLHVGTDFNGDSLPNINDWYDDFSYFDGSIKKPVKGELGRDPAGYFTPLNSGSYLIGYQSTNSYVEISADIFLKYIHEEGLDNALADGLRLKRENKLAKENFSRHAKALIQAGNDFATDSSAQVFGYTLEIIPLQNPYRKQRGDTLGVKILYKGQPAKDILLLAYTKAQPLDRQQIRSNARGMASIKLDKTGKWLLKAVKIVPIKEGKADWQSHWASLTFALK